MSTDPRVHRFQHQRHTYVLDMEHLTSLRVEEEIRAVSPANSCRVHDARPQSQMARMRLPGECPVRTIELLVTQRCNFSCPYCYGEGGTYGEESEMDSQTGRAAVDWLIAQSGKVKRLGISFFGGEPLMNFRLIREVVALAETQGKKAGKEFEFSITTNASLLDDEELAFIKAHGIYVIASMDGPRELQDRQRPFTSGAGSYDVIVPKIRRLLREMPDTPCRATLVGSNDPAPVKQALHEIGFRFVRIAPASPPLLAGKTGRETLRRDVSSLISMYDAEADDLWSDIKDRNTRRLRGWSCAGATGELLAQFLNGEKGFFHCGAGRGLVGISACGDAYPCHRFVGKSEYRLGTVFRGEINRAPYRRSPIVSIKKCADCFAKYLCRGWCPYDHLVVTGSIFTPAEDICRMMQHRTERIAALAAELDDEDRSYLWRESIIPKRACPLDL
jgi:uncharacterized protein